MSKGTQAKQIPKEEELEELAVPEEEPATEVVAKEQVPAEEEVSTSRSCRRS